jgi:hypothetical protein
MACGGGKTDQERAATIGISPSDFDSGWRSQFGDGNELLFAECMQMRFSDIEPTGEAVSPVIQNTTGFHMMRSRTALFANERDAGRVYERLSTQNLQQCLNNLIDNPPDGSATYQIVSAGPLRSLHFGDAASTYRLTAEITPTQAGRPKSTAYLDLSFVRNERAVSLLVSIAMTEVQPPPVINEYLLGLTAQLAERMEP